MGNSNGGTPVFAVSYIVFCKLWVEWHKIQGSVQMQNSTSALVFFLPLIVVCGACFFLSSIFMFQSCLIKVDLGMPLHLH